MRVCVRKSDGMLVEAQSDASEGTLVANAIASGFIASEVEEQTVTLAQYLVLLEVLAPSQDERAQVHIDSIDRVQFELSFDMENRMRAREGVAAVTRVQYRSALINRWKALNP